MLFSHLLRSRSCTTRRYGRIFPTLPWLRLRCWSSTESRLLCCMGALVSTLKWYILLFFKCFAALSRANCRGVDIPIRPESSETFITSINSRPLLEARPNPIPGCKNKILNHFYLLMSFHKSVDKLHLKRVPVCRFTAYSLLPGIDLHALGYPGQWAFRPTAYPRPCESPQGAYSILALMSAIIFDISIISWSLLASWAISLIRAMNIRAILKAPTSIASLAASKTSWGLSLLCDILVSFVSDFVSKNIHSIAYSYTN